MAPLRVCACGRRKENRGPKQRSLTSAVGVVAFTRRYGKCLCGADGSYAADALLGVEGERYTQTVQKHCCRLAADVSFASTSENLHELLGVDICPETARKVVERHGRKMARFQSQDTASEEAFRQAEGEVEFTTDAGKVNTREQGWKDLKIAVIAKRTAGQPTSPEEWKSQRLPLATMVLAFAMIAPAKEFRRCWRPRLRRLGVTCMASIHVLADGASWIWKAVGRVLTGCVQTLDFYHACQHLNRCAERVYGAGTTAKRDAYRYARGLLLRQGWAGVCQWVGELLAVEDERERERRRTATERLIGYFSKHTTRLNYAERLQAGRAIGSGQVEGKAKTLGLRLKAR
ncbi:MAG TPA: hypothetical protein VKU02_00005, partial [Gemmataceae bacterium]|nr:hypothetical protein [Gemmataceae bacterium]